MAQYPIRFKLPKAKPAAPKAPKPQNKPMKPITQADLDRHARMQAEEERSERKIITNTTRMRETPMKKRK